VLAEVIQAFDRGDFESLPELGFRVEAVSADGTAVAVNGEAPPSEETPAPAGLNRWVIG
jgi:hypothetical protein